MLKIKEIFSKIINVTQDFHSLSDELLKTEYLGVVNYYQSFKTGVAKTNVKSNLTKDEALKEIEKTMLILEKELNKRNIIISSLINESKTFN